MTVGTPTRPQPAAFDAVAADYDATFSDTRLGRILRGRVWSLLERHYPPGSHILEINCGTGLDAAWLAGHGRRVTATDAAPAMVAATAARARQAGVTGQVTAVVAPFDTLEDVIGDAAPFDGVLSNFGGLNTLATWDRLAADLGRLVRPGGRAVLVPMGPFCPWEIGWHLVHGQPRTAVRRLRGPASARVGDVTIPVYYPSARRLRRAFGPWFTPVATHNLGLWLPPGYLGHLVDRFPAFFSAVAAIERATARLAGGWGDHYVLVLERRP